MRWALSALGDGGLGLTGNFTMSVMCNLLIDTEIPSACVCLYVTTSPIVGP